MTEQEKQLLLKYLCSILPYGVKYCREYWDYERNQEMCAVGTLESIDKDWYINGTKVYAVWDIKPYIRPMSSMTEEEHNEWFQYYQNAEMEELNKSGDYFKAAMSGDNAKYDWLNAHYFDYRCLIEKELALEAPEGMYN